nr:hypothetical protein OHB51_24245 [Micromonospora sp. NBC_00855]
MKHPAPCVKYERVSADEGGYLFGPPVLGLAEAARVVADRALPACRAQTGGEVTLAAMPPGHLPCTGYRSQVSTIEPYRISVKPEVLVDLRERIGRTRWPQAPLEPG